MRTGLVEENRCSSTDLNQGAGRAAIARHLPGDLVDQRRVVRAAGYRAHDKAVRRG